MSEVLLSVIFLHNHQKNWSLCHTVTQILFKKVIPSAKIDTSSQYAEVSCCRLIVLHSNSWNFWKKFFTKLSDFKHSHGSDHLTNIMNQAYSSNRFESLPTWESTICPLLNPLYQRFVNFWLPDKILNTPSWPITLTHSEMV